nr:hypothetical protein [Massilia sp. JS1662]
MLRLPVVARLNPYQSGKRQQAPDRHNDKPAARTAAQETTMQPLFRPTLIRTRRPRRGLR